MRKVLKWALRTVGAVLGLIVLVGGAGYGYSEMRMGRRFIVPDHSITIRNDSATVAEGRRLVTSRGCVECHGADFGGRVMIDNPAIGVLVSANLTRGARAANFEPRDWELAIRHGIRRDGSSLLVMPSQEFTGVADDQIGAMVAYLQSLPPVTHELPKSRLGPVIRALFAAGKVSLVPADSIDHSRAHPAHMEPEVTPTFGQYVAAGCVGCHGPGFSGGKIPGAPPDWLPAANITPKGIGHYTEADFVRALREGKRPDGSDLNPAMPWKLTKEMTDIELKAIYAYLRTVPAKDYGNR